MMISQVYTYVQTHQIAYIKYLHFLGYQLHISKAVKNKLYQSKWCNKFQHAATGKTLSF